MLLRYISPSARVPESETTSARMRCIPALSCSHRSAGRTRGAAASARECENERINEKGRAVALPFLVFERLRFFPSSCLRPSCRPPSSAASFLRRTSSWCRPSSWSTSWPPFLSIFLSSAFLSCAIAVTLAAANTAATSIEMNCFILIPFSRVVWEKPAYDRSAACNASRVPLVDVDPTGDRLTQVQTYIQINLPSSVKGEYNRPLSRAPLHFPTDPSAGNPMAYKHIKVPAERREDPRQQGLLARRTRPTRSSPISRATAPGSTSRR